MTPDSLFLYAGRVAIGGWLLLAAGLLSHGRWSAPLVLLGGRVIPVLVRAMVLPCLAATLMFGPVGLLLFLLLSMATRRWTRPVGLAA